MGDRSDVILGGKEDVLEDPEMNGVSSLLKMQESNSLHGLNTVLDENEKRVFDSSNGVNLVADACRDVNFSDAKVEGDNERSLQCVPLDGNEKQSDGNEIEEEVNLVDGEHDFAVGDFVWGKIKSHPWWPGKIYDPLDASDYAKKVKQVDKILVAYFGDGTFAWCNPSQLKPFDDNFVEMSSQSSSKNFVNSVENAMDEIGRLVDLKMTCSCVPIDNLSGFGRTLVVNAGIKEGLLIPEGGIDKFSAILFEPVNLLSELKNAAQEAKTTSMLELTVLKSWLSAFYRAKGGHQLPSYYDPMAVPGLEDKSRDWTDDIGCVDVRIKGPEEEDWISSPSGRKYSRTAQSSLHKGFGHYQRRKQKSIAEILEGKMDVQAAENKTQVSGGDKISSQAKSSIKRKKRKSTEQDAADEGKIEVNNETDGEKLRKLKSSLFGKKGKSLENDLEGNDKTEDAAVVNSKPLPSGRKKRRDNVTDDDDVGENEETKNADSVKEADRTASSKGVAKELLREESFSRERKKSKYLSPPYTNIATVHGKKEILAQNLKVSGEAQFGDKPTNISPRIQLNGDLSHNQFFKETSAGLESDSSVPQTQSLEQTIDPSLVKATAKEVLYVIRSAALDPSYLKYTNSNQVEQFFSAFRSSSYCSETNGEYSEKRRGRRRKLEKSEPESSMKEQSQTKTNNSSSSDQKSQRKKVRKSEEAKLKEPKDKQDAVLPSKDTKRKSKRKDKESSEQATGASLLVTFGPGSSLPSKNDIIKIYGKFGSLNKKETEMFYANHCARVVFRKSCEAEEAFKSCQLSSPFGAANVTFRVRYQTETKTRQLREISEGGNAPLLSQLKFMKEKLEGISTMLETSDGKISGDMKSTLESEVKILLEKVSTMSKSA